MLSKTENFKLIIKDAPAWVNTSLHPNDTPPVHNVVQKYIGIVNHLSKVCTHKYIPIVERRNRSELVFI